MSNPAAKSQILAQTYADACLKGDASAVEIAQSAIVSAAQPSAELDQFFAGRRGLSRPACSRADFGGEHHSRGTADRG